MRNKQVGQELLDKAKGAVSMAPVVMFTGRQFIYVKFSPAIEGVIVLTGR